MIKRQIPLLILAASLWGAVAHGAPVVDGTLDTVVYGSAIAIQTVGTQFGDNGSELDAAYATVVSNKLYLMLTGNLEDNWNKLEIFIDSTDAVTTNELNMAGNDGTDALNGLVFDTGFSPDYNFHIRRNDTLFYLDFSDLASQSSIEYGDLFGGSGEGSALTSTSAVNASVIGVGFNNSNTEGIGSGTGAADSAAATNVLTGIELCIDLADIGTPAQTIQIAALINSSANNFLSNQMLGGLPAGTDNLGDPGVVDLNDFSGDQFFTINVPTELTSELNDSLGGSMDVGETNTITITISNLMGTASNITSSLTFDPADGLSIISSNTPAGPLGSGDSLFHTYEVVANTNGFYVLTAEVSSSDIVYITNTLNLTVGRQVRYDNYSIANETSGIAGTIEPGESFDLVITNINDGVGAVNNITNTLTASNSAYFLITPSSDVYSTLGAGESTTTVYRVTCSASTPNGLQTFTVENSSGGQTWSGTLELDIFDRAVPSVSDPTLTIRVAPGQTGSGSVTLANDGNVSTPFMVTADERLPVFYTVETQSVSRISFWLADFQPDTVFDSWTGTDSDPMDIEFGFILFGTEYTAFSVSQYGFLTLSETNGATAQLTPFQTTAAVDPTTIRYTRPKDGLLVVAWGNETGHEFQLRLNADGTVEYLYEFGAWGDGTIGLSAETVSQTIHHIPGQTGKDTLHLAPETWVSFSPVDETLNGFGSTRLLTFTADATAIQSPATYEFTATVNWGESSDEIDVTVLVEDPYIQLDVPPAFAFSGLAGYISPSAILTVTNSGNVPLTYSITDRGLSDAGYSSASVDYQWRYIPETVDTVLPESALGADPVAIGFPFVFYGITRTNLTIWTDGTLTFNDGATINPYSANLLMDDGAQIRFVTDAGLNRFTVTWENIAEPSSGEQNQTFQAVLNRDGTIRFNYMQLIGRPFDEVLSVEEIPIIETNYVIKTIGNYSQTNEIETVVGTNIVTTYNENFDRRSFELAPGLRQVILTSPVSGSILPGSTADITLVGDARSLSGGGVNTILFNTDLDFYIEPSNPLITHTSAVETVSTTFTAKRSEDPFFPSLATQAAMWGTEEPVVSSEFNNADGSRLLSWPAPADLLSRTYTVLYTTSLSKDWEWLATLENGTSYLDDKHNAEPVIFYKVTIQ